MDSSKQRNSTRARKARSPKLTAEGMRRESLATIRDTLDIASRTAAVCSALLAAQAADHDKDIAAVLQRHVVNALGAVDRLLAAGGGS